MKETDEKRPWSVKNREGDGLISNCYPRNSHGKEGNEKKKNNFLIILEDIFANKESAQDNTET